MEQATLILKLGTRQGEGHHVPELYISQTEKDENPLTPTLSLLS